MTHTRDEGRTEQPCAVPIEEQAQGLRDHYEKVSLAYGEWCNQIPVAIDEWEQKRLGADQPGDVGEEIADVIRDCILTVEGNPDDPYVDACAERLAREAWIAGYETAWEQVRGQPVDRSWTVREWERATQDPNAGGEDE